MKINWLIRVKNKAFWMSIIPALLLLIQTVAAPFGVALDFGELGNQLLAIVNAVFAVLAIIGIVADPTTPSVSDSDRALSYTSPGVNENEVAN